MLNGFFGVKEIIAKYGGIASVPVVTVFPNELGFVAAVISRKIIP